ncbi:aromatic compound dioxygenase [Saccharata proteae CBS 121410]|uniref:Aromatic compound dioxygenase n=1 Tax=Saccharata proteae CBS 121410 TaxID=1314787 RepID=A0A9P4HRG1_9PEZI|nr:aromatic compound dioxygenase [Saccharata proteae CBS 121410]
MVQAISALLALLTVSPGLAHPGQSLDDIDHEIAARAIYLKNAPRDLSHCAAKMQECGALGKRQASGTPGGSAPSGSPTGGAGGDAPGDDTSLTAWGSQLQLDRCVRRRDRQRQQQLRRHEQPEQHLPPRHPGTDSDGVAQFSTLFPGHYAGRATHIHVFTHMNSTVLENGSITAGNITHTGQLFFDQDLIDDINSELAPYNANTIDVVENADDRVFAGEAVAGSDPVLNYVLLGDAVEDGLFAWITMGIDRAARYGVDPAAIYGSGGGYVA